MSWSSQRQLALDGQAGKPARTERTQSIGTRSVGEQVAGRMKLDKGACVAARPLAPYSHGCGAIRTGDLKNRVARPGAAASGFGAVRLAPNDMGHRRFVARLNEGSGADRAAP